MMNTRLIPLAAIGVGAALSSAEARGRRGPRPTPLPEVADEFAGTAERPGRPLTLWYRRPASNWNAALPVGNGRLGCMVYGGVSVERLSLNEDSLWAGGTTLAPEQLAEKGVPAGIKEGIRKARELMFEDKLAEAEQLLWRTIRAPKRHHINSFGCSQLLGLLDLHFSEGPSSAAGYRRDLDLDAAVHRVRYSKDGVAFTREVFSSVPDQVIVVRLEADKPGSLSFAARLSRGDRAETRADGSDALVMKGQAYALKNGMNFIARVKAGAEGGRVLTKENQLHVEGADAVTILVACATDYLPEPPTFRGNPYEETSARQIKAASKKTYAELRDAHVAAHRELFRRMSLDLGKSPAARTALPMDERVTKAGDLKDPEFLETLFQYGRYMLICSSRPGCRPAHLQGLWIGGFSPSWNGDYHLDLNVQMCYWAAGPCNMAECALPVVDLVRGMVPSGRRTARLYHGVEKGWVCHLATNHQGYTTPVAHQRYGYAAGCAAWLMQTLWEHYAFTLDEEYLRRVWPLFREQGEFWLEWLVEDPETGRLVSGPASSPENSFGSPNGKKVGLTMVTAFDQQCARELLTEVLEAAEVLGIEDDFVRRVGEARDNILPPQVCRETGAILEWSRQRYGTGGKHRHRSHIVGLYPGRMITVERTPEWAAAARRALELRGPGGPPWTPAWDMSFWARLRRPEKAMAEIPLLLKLGYSIHHNMLARCGGEFQLDANMGYAAGVAEMLLQSHAGHVELLPALPKAWPDGSVSGICARGGFEVSMVWRAGRLASASILSKCGGTCRVRYGGASVELETAKGRTYDLKGLLDP